MTADRLDPPEEGRLLRATLILLTLVLASGMLFGAISGVREREDEIEEARDHALRVQTQMVSEHLNSVTQQAEQDATPAGDGERGDSQPDPS